MVPVSYYLKGAFLGPHQGTGHFLSLGRPKASFTIDVAKRATQTGLGTSWKRVSSLLA